MRWPLRWPWSASEQPPLTPSKRKSSDDAPPSPFKGAAALSPAQHDARVAQLSKPQYSSSDDGSDDARRRDSEDEEDADRDGDDVAEERDDDDDDRDEEEEDSDTNSNTVDVPGASLFSIPTTTEPKFELDPLQPPGRTSAGHRKPTNYLNNDPIAFPEPLMGASHADATVAEKLDALFDVDAAGWTPTDRVDKAVHGHDTTFKYTVVKCKQKGPPACPFTARLDFQKDGSVEIRLGDHPHVHPDKAQQLDVKRGLPPQVKAVLAPLLQKKKWRMRDALRLLREAGCLEHWDEPGFKKEITKKVRGYMKRSMRKKTSDFWKHSYGSLETLVRGYYKSDAQISELVREKQWDTPFCFDQDINGEAKTNYFTSATVRSLCNASNQALLGLPTWAALDGTGRVNYQGKILVFVATIDGAGHCRLISSFLLSKGETTAEIARGLKATAHAIGVIHQAMQQHGAEGLYDAKGLEEKARASNVPGGYKWLPITTMNDDSNAIMNAWDELVVQQLQAMRV